MLPGRRSETGDPADELDERERRERDQSENSEVIVSALPVHVFDSISLIGVCQLEKQDSGESLSSAHRCRAGLARVREITALAEVLPARAASIRFCAGFFGHIPSRRKARSRRRMRDFRSRRSRLIACSSRRLRSLRLGLRVCRPGQRVLARLRRRHRVRPVARLQSRSRG